LVYGLINQYSTVVIIKENSSGKNFYFVIDSGGLPIIPKAISFMKN